MRPYLKEVTLLDVISDYFGGGRVSTSVGRRGVVVSLFEGALMTFVTLLLIEDEVTVKEVF